MTWQEKNENGWFTMPPEEVETYGKHAAPLDFDSFGKRIAIVDLDGYYDAKPKKHARSQ